MPDRRELEIYPHAAAVFSHPVQFVELSAMRVESPEAPTRRPGRGARASPSLPWRPFVRLDPRKKKGNDLAEQASFNPIMYPRWVYVFRRDVVKLGVPDWVEELRIETDQHDNEYNLLRDRNGARPQPSKTPYTIAAVPMSPVGPNEAARPPIAKAASRPAPKKLAKNPRFARRIRGRPQEYFFFGTRVRLEPEAIDRLQLKVADWALPIVFEGKAPYVGVDAPTGDLIVPIFDPLSIAIGIHDRLMNARDALIHYLVPSSADDADGKTATEERLKKVLLARTLDGLISSSPDGDAAKQIVKGLSPKLGGAKAAELFLDQYQHQVDYRLKWSERWGLWLANWLRAEPMRKFLPSIHLQDVVGNPTLAAEFFVPFLACTTGMISTAATRTYVTEVLERPDDYPWFSRWIMPDQPLTSDEYQALRKLESGSAEAIKEFGPILVRQLDVDSARKVLMRRMKLRWPQLVIDEAVHVEASDLGTYVVLTNDRYKRGTRTRRMAIRSEEELKEQWHGAPTKLLVVIEALNVVLSLGTLKEALDGADGVWDKGLVLAGLAGSGLDLTSAFLAAAGVTGKKTNIIGFISGAIDTVVAVDDFVGGYRQHDPGRMMGSALIAGGSGVAALVALGVIEVPGVGAIALFVIGVGYVVKKVFSFPDFELFGRHCTWGVDHPGSGTAGFATAPFAKWSVRPGGYDIQLSSLFNLLCEFRIVETTGSPLVVTSVDFEFGWIPPKAYLVVNYEETGDHAIHEVTSVVSFDAHGTATSVGTVDLAGDPKTGYVAYRRGMAVDRRFRKIRYSARLVIPVPNTSKLIHVPALDKAPIELWLNAADGLPD